MLTRKKVRCKVESYQQFEWRLTMSKTIFTYAERLVKYANEDSKKRVANAKKQPRYPLPQIVSSRRIDKLRDEIDSLGYDTAMIIYAIAKIFMKKENDKDIKTLGTLLSQEAYFQRDRL